MMVRYIEGWRVMPSPWVRPSQEEEWALLVYLYYYSMMMIRYGGLAGAPFSPGETYMATTMVTTYQHIEAQGKTT